MLQTRMLPEEGTPDCSTPSVDLSPPFSELLLVSKGKQLLNTLAIPRIERISDLYLPRVFKLMIA